MARSRSPTRLSDASAFGRYPLRHYVPLWILAVVNFVLIMVYVVGGFQRHLGDHRQLNDTHVYGDLTVDDGILDKAVVSQSGTAAENLTNTSKNLVWYANTAQAGAITLPQATADNVGMVIKIVVGTTAWSTTAFKLGFADGGSTVMTGQIILNANDGGVTETAGFVITADAKALQIDADDITAAGGAIGSTYEFTYLEKNLVYCLALGMITTGAPTPDAASSSTTGT